MVGNGGKKEQNLKNFQVLEKKQKNFKKNGKCNRSVTFA